MCKYKLTTTSDLTAEQIYHALSDVMGHNGDKMLVSPAPPPTITPHWLNKDWQYIPSTEHQDSTKFKERMEKRRIAAQGK